MKNSILSRIRIMGRMLVMLLMSFAINTGAKGQTYLQATNTSGTANFGCEAVTVTSTGDVTPGFFGCITGPYNLSICLSHSCTPGYTAMNAAYTWSFAPGVCAVRISFVELNTNEQVNVYVNGVHINFHTMGTISSYTTDPCYSYPGIYAGTPIILPSGDLGPGPGTNPTAGDACTIDLTAAMIGMPITSVTLSCPQTPCGCGIAASFFFLPCVAAPGPIVVPGPLCIGGIMTLSDGVTGGTWSSNAGIAAINSTTGVVTGISAGNATITYTLPDGCYITANVGVGPAPIIGPNSGCIGSTITLNNAVSGGIWSSSSTTVSVLYATSGLVMGVSAGTAVITYTLPGGCYTTTTITINGPGCGCTAFGGAGFTKSAGGTIGSGTLAPGNYYLTGDVTITGTVTATDAVILIAPNVHIYVDPTASLTLNGCHLFCCSSMWYGITLLTNTGVTSTGTLVVQGDGAGQCSLIEDAYTAVTIAGPATPTGGGNILTCNNAVFNRNYTGISISNYNPTTPVTYPFEVQNTVFTSRDFSGYNVGSGYPFVWPNTTGLYGLRTAWTGGSAYDEPFNINNPTNAFPPSGSYPVIGCKVATGASQTGIFLQSVGGNTSMGGGAFSYSGVVIGEPNTALVFPFSPPNNPEQNLFESLNYGVQGIDANVTVHNSAFAHMTVKGGYGIYTTMDDGNPYQLTVEESVSYGYGIFHTTTISSNAFYNCIWSVASNNYYQIKGDNAGIITEQGTAGGSFYGYNISSGAYSSVELNGNTITNVANAISMSTTPGSSIPGGPIGSINVNNNSIYAAIGGAAPTTQYTSFGISLQNSIGSAATGPYIGAVNTNSNTILDAYRGIYINGYVAQTPTSNNNNITVVQDPAAVSSPTNSVCWGINHTSCIGNIIGSNAVSGGNSTALSDDVSAYIAESNASMLVQCNMANATWRGFEFDLNNPCWWRYNTMEHNNEGMALNNSVIGPQISNTNPSDNGWAGPASWWASNFQTYVIGTPSSSSPLYTSNIPTHNSGMPPTVEYTTSDLHFVFSGLIPIPCVVGGGSGTSGGATQREALENITRNIVPYMAYTNAQEWAGQYITWRAIHADTALTSGSAALDTFKAMAALSRLQYLTDIEDSLARGNVSYVTAQLALSPTPLCGTGMDTDATTGVIVKDDHSIDYIINNNKAYYSVYLDYISHTLSSADSGQIKTIAGYCPIEYGPVVYKARALYASVFNELRVWNDSCTGIDTGTYRVANLTPTLSKGEGGQKYTLYPNPNDGNITITQMVIDNEPVQIEILDLLGRAVYRNSVNFDDGSYRLQMTSLMPGMYLTEITDSKGRKFNYKFVKE